MRAFRFAAPLLLTAHSVVMAPAASKPDFTGAWELDVKESDFGNLPKPARMTMQSIMQGDHWIYGFTEEAAGNCPRTESS